MNLEDLEFPQVDKEDFHFCPEMLDDIEMANEAQLALAYNMKQIQLMRIHNQWEKDSSRTAEFFQQKQIRNYDDKLTRVAMNEGLRFAEREFNEIVYCTKCKKQGCDCVYLGACAMTAVAERIETMIREIALGKK